MMKYILFCLGLTMAYTAKAQTIYYYRGSGGLELTSSWSTNSNGVGGASPANFTNNNQHFYIRNVTNVSLTNTWTVSGTNTAILVNNGVNFTVAASLTTRRFIINNGGTVQTNTAITMSSATDTFRIDNGGLYIHNNTTTPSSSIFAGIEAFGPGSTFRVNNWKNNTTTLRSGVNASATAGGNNYSFGNLEINWAIGAGTTWNQAFASLPTATYLAAGNFTLTSNFNGVFQFTSANNVDPDVYVYGNVYLNGGTLDMSGSNNGSDAYLNVNGDFTQTAGTMTATGSGGFGHLWTYGSGTSTWTFSGGSRSWVDYYIYSASAPSPKRVNLGSDFNMGTSGLDYSLYYAFGFYTLEVGANSTFDAANYKISYASKLAILNSGLFRLNNPNGLFTRTGSTLGNVGFILLSDLAGNTFEYYNTGAQYVSGATSFYQTLKISGTGTKQLEGNTSVDVNFTFNSTSDKLDVGNNKMSIANGATITNASASSYFAMSANGRLMQNNLAAAVSKWYPIGTTTTYLPMYVTPAASGTDYSAGVYTGVDASVTPYLYSANMVDAAWTLDRDTGTADLSQIRFEWPSTSEGVNFQNAPSLAITSYISTVNPPTSLLTWSQMANTVNDTAANYLYTTQTVSTFGQKFIIGAVPSGMVLPLEFTSFTARRVGDHNQLNWSMDNLQGVNRFEVERSINGVDFSTIATVSVNTRTSYSFADIIGNDITYYYRVKAVIHTNDVKYTGIIAIKSMKTAYFALVGNVVQHQLKLQYSAASNAYVRIVTTDGKLIMNSRLTDNTTSNLLDVSRLASGIYFVQYVSAGEVVTERFIKQ